MGILVCHFEQYKLLCLVYAISSTDQFMMLAIDVAELNFPEYPSQISADVNLDTRPAQTRPRLKPRSCTCICNLSSANVRLATTIGRGKFWDVIGQRHKFAYEWNRLKNQMYENHSPDGRDSPFKTWVLSFCIKCNVRHS